jgi:hypothetical protein
MKNLFLKIVFMILPVTFYGQHISSSLVSTAGDYYTSGNYSLSVTIGEAVTDFYSSPLTLLSTGFQQPLVLSSTFLATVSNAWEVRNNWNNGIPDQNTNAVISSDKLAVVNTANIAKCNHLKILPLAKLTINSLKDLNVKADFLIQSDTSGTASFINWGSLQSNSNTIEKYFNIASADDFHMLSSPVNSQSILSDFSPQNQSLYAWNEITGMWLAYEDFGFAALNNGAYLVPGKGYAVSYPLSCTKVFSGNMNQTAVSSNLTISSGMYAGWNFLGNPYPSAINWNTASAFTRNILADAGAGEYAYWVWNPTVGNYGTYISNASSGTNGVSNYIAATQGYWVKANTPGSFIINNTACEHAVQVFLKNTGIESKTINLKITNNQNTYSDELQVNFGNTENNRGAEKMYSIYPSAPNIYSSKLNKKWSISKLTTVEENVVVPIGFEAGTDGNYSFSAMGVEAFNKVVLEDLKTGLQQDLSINNSYSFNALTSDNENRFLLRFFTANGINDNVEKMPSIYYNNHTIDVFNPWLGKTTLSIYDVNGKLIQSYSVNKGKEIYHFKSSSGVYILKMMNENQVFVKKEVIY